MTHSQSNSPHCKDGVEGLHPNGLPIPTQSLASPQHSSQRIVTSTLGPFMSLPLEFTTPPSSQSQSYSNSTQRGTSVGETIPDMTGDLSWPWPASYDSSTSYVQKEASSGQFTHPQYLYSPNGTLAAQPNVYHGDLQGSSAFSTGFQFAHSTQSSDLTCPRSYPGVDAIHSMNSMVEAYPPSAYQLEPQKPPEYLASLDRVESASPLFLEDDFDSALGENSKNERLGSSQYGQLYESCYEGSDDPLRDLHGDQMSPPSDPIKEHADDDEGPDREEPYAKLIYRCLMEQPRRCMVLRDIYDWFQKNTDKANNKETKGWQNSIRHNLSMNGAFEKVDSGSPEDKKGFMWRLTETAIAEGVKSTTRYRSKLPNKRPARPHHHPAPQRQASGAKGGQAARKSARLRRSERNKELVSYPRSTSSICRHGGMQGLGGLPIPQQDNLFDTISELDNSSDIQGPLDNPYFYSLPHAMPQFEGSVNAPGSSASSFGLECSFLPPASSVDYTDLTAPNTPVSLKFEEASSPGKSGIASDLVHFMEIPQGESLFYSESPESAEPATPPSFTNLGIGDGCFLDTDLAL